MTTLAHLLRFAADVRLDEIDRALLERFRQERLEAGNSPKTVNYYLASVSAALTLAVNLGYLTTKPRLKKLKIKKPLPRFFIA